MEMLPVHLRVHFVNVTGPLKGPPKGPLKGPPKGLLKGPPKGPLEGPPTGPLMGPPAGPYPVWLNWPYRSTAISRI